MSDRILAAQRAAEIITAAERALDHALATAAQLVVELPDLQDRAGLHASMGQPAMVELSETIAHMTQARGRLVRTHNKLAAVQRKVGLDRLTLGPGNTKDEGDQPVHPPMFGKADEAPRLRAV